MRIKGRKILQWRVERKRWRVWRGGNNYLLDKYHLYNIFFTVWTSEDWANDSLSWWHIIITGQSKTPLLFFIFFHFIPIAHSHSTSPQVTIIMYSFCTFWFVRVLSKCMFLSTFNLCFIILFTLNFSSGPYI